jgi:DNA-directed RNA polymerase subunit K/omega
MKEVPMSMEVVEKVYADRIARRAPELMAFAEDFAIDPSRRNIFRLKIAVEEVERDIAVRDALRSQMEVLS